jgi:integrase
VPRQNRIRSKKLGRCLKVLSEPSATAVASAAFTGLRLGEVRGLTWPSYEPAPDEESLGWLNVTRSVWRNTVGDPKTAKSKAPVPVIPQLAQRLSAHRLKCGNPVAGPIFRNSVGNPLDLNACYQREMKDVLKRAGTWHGWHGFRRGLASNLNRLGVDDPVIQRILRHSTVATTQIHYIKTASPDAIAAMRQFSEALLCSTCAPDESSKVGPVVQ